MRVGVDGLNGHKGLSCLGNLDTKIDLLEAHDLRGCCWPMTLASYIDLQCSLPTYGDLDSWATILEAHDLAATTRDLPMSLTDNTGGARLVETCEESGQCLQPTTLATLI